MEHIRGFEKVSENHRQTTGEIILPKRGTSRAAAYDIYSPVKVTIEPGKSKMIWTDVKAYCLQDEVLLLNVRSSMGKHPVMIANTQGWVDSDYYNNPGNDGNIGIRLFNLGEEDYFVEIGDRIAQGMFIKYFVADNGNTEETRVGGFGSTK